MEENNLIKAQLILILKGVEFRREGYTVVGSTKEDFIVSFGSPQNLARMVSFTDHYTTTSTSGAFAVGVVNTPVDNIIKKWLNFNENGGVTPIAKNDEEWVLL